MKDIILASASPRRSEILHNIGIDFSVEAADIDEKLPRDVPPQEVVKSLSLQKAEHIAKIHPESIIIGADTIVVINGKILGKPTSKENAAEMLEYLSGKVHSVFTGVTVICGEATYSFCEETKVEFYDLTDVEISAYVESGEPMDKAGAYGIQGLGCTLVKRIDGDYYNVVGLPISKLYKKLGELNNE